MSRRVERQKTLYKDQEFKEVTSGNSRIKTKELSSKLVQKS